MSSIGARNKGYSGSDMLAIVKRVIFARINISVRCKISKMAENLRSSSLYSTSPFYQLFITLVYIVVAGGAVFIALLMTGIYIFNPELEVLRDPLLSAGRNDILFLRYLLISQHISLFIIPGVILIFRFRYPGQNNLRILKKPDLDDAAIVTVLAFCLIPVTGITGELNSGMRLPELLSGVENWMRGKENMAGRLFELIISPEGKGSLAVNLVMIAILPALGEELIFRGIFQRILTKIFSSGHTAIIVTAFFFSAIHFQFYGFLPRFILGLVYGYLLFWSGTLWLPVIAHFANNAISVIIVYVQVADPALVRPEIPVMQKLASLVVPVIAGSIILFYFSRKAASRQIAD